MALLDTLRSPLGFLQSRLPTMPHLDVLAAEQAWWKTEGVAISGTVDRAGPVSCRVGHRNPRSPAFMRQSGI